MEECKRIRRELMYHGVIVDFYKDTMRMPNGHEVDWDLISHKGAAAVVAVRDDGQLFMVRQYRNPLERITLELPAGALNFRADIFTTVAFCDEKISIYVASDLKPTKQHLDEDEFLDVFTYPVEELIQMIYDGKIQDSKTICGLMTYYQKYCK